MKDESLVGSMDSKFLNSLTFQLAELEAGQDIIVPLLHSIRTHTNAVLGFFSLYNEAQKTMIVKGIEGDGNMLNTVIKIVGSKVLETPSPLSDEAYVQIVEERIAVSKSLTQITFGSIPKAVDVALQKITGIKYFYGVAHILSGKLYGTTLLAFRENQPHPSIGLLNSFAYLTALTLRKNLAEKALIQSESNLRRITDNIRDVVFVTDLNLNTTFVTPSIERMHGDTVEQYLKRNVEQRHPPETIAYLKAVLNEEFENEKCSSFERDRSRVVEAQLIKADGTIIETSMHISFVRDEKGKPVGIQGVTRDITELKETEQMLRQLNADKDRFLQILAHDLKNPIANLVSTSDVLKRYHLDFKREEVEKLLNLFNDISNSTFNLLQNLLLWSKAQSGKMQPEIQNIDFYEICKGVALEFAPILNQKKISIEYPQQPVILAADKNMMTAVMRNLVSNAIKFTNFGGSVTILLNVDSGSTTICVRDTGVGISSENISKLWGFTTPYTTSGTNNEQGNGLGLLICKEFVEIHGGKIWVDSKVGQGSQFWFSLPRQNG
ncbi:PAS domain-containing sensor histidine kinase [Perlabentimonas gracilis]|uniref:PAS domain-containing sensor histidine kinase n=1 Tax=Perlabentimonas gracilis TaxID=2715279 RepID=UPI001408255F|nr:PAS domain-containing sensor histidine kinase [Perlabentimonas gracilis]NHB67476.1 PAS domain S-box protein [Perlabentimonas gracilis]